VAVSWFIQIGWLNSYDLNWMQEAHAGSEGGFLSDGALRRGALSPHDASVGL